VVGQQRKAQMSRHLLPGTLMVDSGTLDLLLP